MKKIVAVLFASFFATVAMAQTPASAGASKPAEHKKVEHKKEVKKEEKKAQ